jgi:beta-lactamase regulating signal transducer with metallopeptidase domain
VHWVTRKLHEARELACDERAIECGGFTAPEYASHLLDVVARTGGRAAYEALAIGRTAARLERRIDSLLEDRGPRRGSSHHAAVLTMLLIAALVGLRPQLAVPTTPAASSQAVSVADPGQQTSHDEGGCDEQGITLQCGP